MDNASRTPDNPAPNSPDGSWDMSQERAFIENLLCQRFNFLLVFYSLVVAAAFTTTSQTNLNIVITVGALICLLLSLPIARSQHKLDLILEDIWRTQPEHPSKRSDDRADDLARVPCLMRLAARRSRRGIIGYWIPLFCWVSLCAGAVLAWFGVLKPN